MVYELLGRDQQQPGGVFSQTDYDRAVLRLHNYLISSYPKNWETVTKMATPEQFVTDLINTLKSMHAILTDDTRQAVQINMLKAYPDRYTRVDLLDMYLDSFIKLTRDGKIPQSIYDPAYYVPEPDTDIPAALTAAGRNIGLFALAGVALYAFFTKGIAALAHK